MYFIYKSNTWNTSEMEFKASNLYNNSPLKKNKLLLFGLDFLMH